MTQVFVTCIALVVLSAGWLTQLSVWCAGPSEVHRPHLELAHAPDDCRVPHPTTEGLVQDEPAEPCEDTDIDFIQIRVGQDRDDNFEVPDGSDWSVFFVVDLPDESFPAPRLVSDSNSPVAYRAMGFRDVSCVRLNV